MEAIVIEPTKFSYDVATKFSTKYDRYLILDPSMLWQGGYGPMMDPASNLQGVRAAEGYTYEYTALI